MSKSVKKSKTSFRLSDLTPGEVIEVKMYCAHAGINTKYWKSWAKDYMRNYGRRYLAQLVDAAIKREIKNAYADWVFYKKSPIGHE